MFKQTFLKTCLLLAAVVCSLTMSAVDWSEISFLGDGAGGGAYSNKYKVEKATGVQDIVNIQHPGFSSADGIYMSFVDAAFGEFRVAGTKLSYDVQGAGICLHLSNFTAQETEVNVMTSDNTAVRWTFHVFYADGTAGEGGGEQGGGGSTSEPEPTSIDWTSYGWVTSSNSKFKIGALNAANMPNEVVSVQQPGFATKSGIYMTFPGEVSDCSHDCAKQGGGMVLYIDQFFAMETEVTVNYAGGSKTFVVFYADGIDFSAPAPIASEYCNYSGPQTTQDGKACAITWVTNNAGDVVITLSDGPAGGYTGVSFRGDCFEGDFDKFKVISAANGIENASVYFTRERSAAENYYILRKNATPLPAGKIIIRTDATLAWTSAENASRWQNGGLVFSYTYGTTCPILETPANVAVANDGTITFDAVAGAEKYVAHVFNGVNEVYAGEVTNGGVIDYPVYEAATLTVKLEAVTGGMSSDLSDATAWTPVVSPLPASIWCETAGVATTKNNWGDAHFTLNTLANGNVLVEISSPDGSAANFRGGAEKKGMNGTFILNGSSADFNTYFNVVKAADNKTVTLTLVDPSSKPALGSIIDYSGQIECATSQNRDDYSNYNILDYIYGTRCPDIAVTGVTLDKANAELFEGRTLTLTATINPHNAANKNITWTSSDDNVATVVDGVVTAVAAGEATITVTTEDGGFTASCVVMVSAALVGPTSAPTAPAVPAAQVRALYSSRYDLAINPQHALANWGSSPFSDELVIGDDHVRLYNMSNAVIVWGQNDGSNSAIRGLDGMRNGSYTGLDASLMEYLHVDIWCSEVRNFTSVINDDGRGAQGNTTAGAWTSYNVPLAGINHGEKGIENVRWLKFDGFANGDIVAIANVYFYTTQDGSDDQAPVVTSASYVAESATYTSARVVVEATDNVGVIAYRFVDATNNYDKSYGVTSATASSETITLTNLKAGVSYNFTVTAKDATGNETEVGVNLAVTTPAIEGNENVFYGIEDRTAASKIQAWEHDYPMVLYYSMKWNANGSLDVNMYLDDPDDAHSHAGFVCQILDYVTNNGNPIYYDMQRIDDVYSVTMDGPFEQNKNDFRFRLCQGTTTEQPRDVYTVGSESEPYRRDVAGKTYGTLCLPFTATVEGVTLYTISSVTDEAVNLTSVEDNLAEAGKAYIYKTTANELVATYTEVAAHGANEYLVGNLSAQAVAVPDGSYGIAGGEIRPISGNNVTCGQYKAYITLPAGLALTARRISFAENTATGMDELQTVEDAKLMENGQLIIIRNGVRYNVLGQIIK